MKDGDELERLQAERDRYAEVVSELNERFDEKVEELSHVRQIGDLLGNRLDQRAVCLGTVNFIQDALAPENCSVMLIDSEGDLVLVAARGAFDDAAASYDLDSAEAAFKAGQGIAGAVVESKAAIRLTDATDDHRYLERSGATVLPRSLLCVPLLARGRALGVLNLSDSVPDAFEPKHERLLALVANTVAIALENASLFTEVTRSRERLATENASLRQQLTERFSVRGLIGSSPPFRAALQLVEKVADTTANVMITGESGTGKEVFARALHYNSRRADKPFVAINCAALPESLLEAELFGIEKGVATGVDARVGTFERAHGGTLFLDEIGDMPASVQVRMLRVLQERAIQRVGGSDLIEVDVRIITATHRNLREEISGARFREDLFYRLKVVAIELPSLSDRREDILPLANHFAARFSAHHARPDRPFSKTAARSLLSHTWPGNVRELEHAVEQAVLLCDTEEILPADLGLTDQTPTGVRVQIPHDSLELHPILDEVTALAERQLILRALEIEGGNRSRTATRLGIARRTLIYKIQRYDIN